ncbi:MAG: permease [Patescibacteria group bacterium]|jgi:hypothetical protein
MDTIFYPIKLLAEWLTGSVFSIYGDSRLGEVINFFIYDTIKILILLFVIIFVVSMIRSFLPPEKIRRLLSHKNQFIGNILASLLGIVTPFCTCSAIPLFLGFIEAGVPLGVTFSFLIASPMINEVALVLLLGMFGWKIALLYIVSGLLIAIVSGLVIGRLKPEKLLIEIDYQKNIFNEQRKITWKYRVNWAREYALNITKKVWVYVVVGIALGAIIHGYVPTDFLARYAGSDKWYAVPFATLLGVPLYSNAAGIVPLISVLTEKGVAIGTVLAFMMAVTGLSLPEFMILKKVMKTKLIIIFASIVALGIMLTGYLFNLVLK